MPKTSTLLMALVSVVAAIALGSIMGRLGPYTWLLAFGVAGLVASTQWSKSPASRWVGTAVSAGFAGFSIAAGLGWLA